MKTTSGRVREKPVSFRRTRVTRFKFGGHVLSFRVEHTDKGNRLLVSGPDGMEIEHISCAMTGDVAGAFEAKLLQGDKDAQG